MIYVLNLTKYLQNKLQILRSLVLPHGLNEADFLVDPTPCLSHALLEYRMNSDEEGIKLDPSTGTPEAGLSFGAKPVVCHEHL